MIIFAYISLGFFYICFYTWKINERKKWCSIFHYQMILYKTILKIVLQMLLNFLNPKIETLHISIKCF